MATAKKETMIAKSSRPSAIDLDAPISSFKMRDLLSVVNSQMLEHLKYTPQPEYQKPESFKPEHIKPEKEIVKPEKELRKPEKELIKSEKELVKPEKELLKPEKEHFKPELSKPEKEFDPIAGELRPFVDAIASRVVELMKSQGLVK